MAGTPSTRRLKTVATLASIISLTLNFGLIDFVDGFTGFVDQARNQVLDVGWGAVFGVIVPAGLLVQLRRPESRIAGIQQTALVAVALAVAGAAGKAWWYLALAGGVGGLAALLLALHPGRRGFFRRGARARPALLVAAAAAAPPCAIYAWRMASAQRRNLPPDDAVSNGLHHWTVMAALALLVVTLVLLAALGTPGWRIPAGSAAVAAGAWAISCLFAPEDAAASEGHLWAAVVLAWSVATVAVAARASQPRFR
jgi:hypothetical protein